VSREREAREFVAREVAEKWHTSSVWHTNEIAKRDENYVDRMPFYFLR
jgi:hypothetical protein